MSDVPDGITDAMNAQYKRDNHMTNPLDQIERLQQRVTELEQLVVGLQYARQTDMPTVAPADVWHERNDEACRKDKPQSDTAGGDAWSNGLADQATVNALVEGMKDKTMTMHGMAIGALAAIRDGKVPGIYASALGEYTELKKQLAEAVSTLKYEKVITLQLRAELEAMQRQLDEAEKDHDDLYAQLEKADRRSAQDEAVITKQRADLETVKSSYHPAILHVREQDAKRERAEAKLSEAADKALAVATKYDALVDEKIKLMARIRELEKELARVNAINGGQHIKIGDLRESNERLKAFHAYVSPRQPEYAGGRMILIYQDDRIMYDKWLAARGGE